MGVLARLLGREKRSDGEVFNLLDGRSPFTGIYGSPDVTAARSATALACIATISSSLGSLVPRLYRVEGGERTEIASGPFAALLRRPSRQLAWNELIQTLMASVLTHGNGLVEILAGFDGTLTELRLIPWPGVQVRVLDTGDVVYDVPDAAGKTRRILAGEAIHIRDLADGNGLVGVPRLARCPDVMLAALGAQTFATQVFEHGSTPSGIVTVPPQIKKEGLERLEASFNGKYAGNRRVLFMQDGQTFIPLDITPENSQALESRKFSCEEIARVFGVPAIMVGINDHSTMTNSETSGRFFATHCLAPWATRIEQAFTYALFGSDETYAIELDMTALLRGSDAERWACWAIALDKGVLSPADVRQAENWTGPPPEHAAVSEPATR